MIAAASQPIIEPLIFATCPAAYYKPTDIITISPRQEIPPLGERTTKSGRSATVDNLATG